MDRIKALNNFVTESSNDAEGAACLPPRMEENRNIIDALYLREIRHLEKMEEKAENDNLHTLNKLMRSNRLSAQDDKDPKKDDYYNFPLKTYKEIIDMEEKLKLTSLNHLIIVKYK